MSVNLSTLIKMVKARPEIYQRHFLSDEYDNTWKAKEAAWRDVSKKLGVDVTILKKKWRTLRDQFQRNYKKVQSSNGEKIEVHWPYFEKLLFLKDHCRTKDSSCNRSKVENEEEETHSSQFIFNTDGLLKDDSLKYEDFDSKFETVCDDYIDHNNEEKESDDYLLVTTSSTEQHFSSCDDKMQNICDSNTFDDRLKSMCSGQSRKSINNEHNGENVQISIKRAKYLEDNLDENELNRQIFECLANIKKTNEKHIDHIDHFCNFLGSMLKQWPTKRQCEAMNYFTNYVMENHIIFRQENE